LGRALGHKGTKEALLEATAAFRNAIHLQADYVSAYNDLGFTLIRLGAFDEATATYKTAICLQPDYPLAYAGLGLALRSKGQFGEALAVLRQGQEWGSKDPHLSSRFQQEIRECERLIELDRACHKLWDEVATLLKHSQAEE
jgi:Flp pilus assembly protein TadD